MSNRIKLSICDTIYARGRHLAPSVYVVSHEYPENGWDMDYVKMLRESLHFSDRYR
jgi:hypothetical protein